MPSGLKRTIMNLLGLLVFVYGCQKPGGVSQAGQMVSIGTTKADLLGIPPEYRALHVGLENALTRPVAFHPQRDGEAIFAQMEQGNVSFAILSAGEYASITDPSKLNLLASGVNGLGKTSRQALIVCRASDKRFKTISDCQNKRFAFGTFGDVLTDLAAREALKSNGVPLNKLLTELLPPPFAMEGRLYVQNDAALKIALDLTVNAGVIDELVFQKLPATGGNAITGPSRDQFHVLGSTSAVPELVVVAGPSADPETTRKLQAYLLNGVKRDAMICKQLGVTGFAPADRAAYDAVGQLVRSGR